MQQVSCYKDRWPCSLSNQLPDNRAVLICPSLATLGRAHCMKCQAGMHCKGKRHNRVLDAE